MTEGIDRFRWSKFHPIGALPPPRRSHTCVQYGPNIYVFGGGTGIQALGDLWTLDVSQNPLNWEWVCLRQNPYPVKLSGKSKAEDDVYKRAAVQDRGGPGPAPRGYHTANVVKSSMIVVGGSNGAQCYNDIWICDLGMLTPVFLLLSDLMLYSVLYYDGLYRITYLEGNQHR